MKKQAKTVKKQEVVEQVVPVVVAPVAVIPDVAAPVRAVVPPAPVVATSAPSIVVEKPVGEDFVPMEKRNMRIYWAGIFVAVVILVMTGVVFWWRVKLPVVTKSENLKEQIVVVEPIKNVEEVKEVDEMERSVLTVEVLNGTGKSGLAGQVGAKLKELGYLEVSTGNADVAKKTVVTIKAGNLEKGEIEDDLKEVLGFRVVIVEEEGLEADIRVVLGQDATAL